jgi:hypothetical protein
MNKLIFLRTLCGSSVLILPILASPADLSPLFATLYKPACDRLIPDYEEENRANYLAWQREHKSDLEMINSLPEVQSKPEELANKLTSLSAEESSKLEKDCYRIADLFQTAALEDSRFSSPDRIWVLYRRSLQALDRKTATLCLVGDEKIRHIEFFKNASDQQLREAANSITDFKIGATAEYTAEGSFVTELGKWFPIKFGKVGKNWKIYDMTLKSY